MDKLVVVLVALYRYRNFPIRIMHSLLENIEGVKTYSIFFKNCEANAFRYPTAREEKLFIEQKHDKPQCLALGNQSACKAILRKNELVINYWHGDKKDQPCQV